MKRVILLILSLSLLLSARASAEAFLLDENRILQGMGRSWRQGYEPTAEGGYVTICLPLTSDSANGRLTATLLLNDEDVSPFSTQKLTTECWKNEGYYAVRLRLPLVSARRSGDYGGRVVVEGKDGAGNPLRAEYPVVIRVRDGVKEPLRPGLSSVTSSLAAGENGLVNAILTNTSRYAEMQNIELTITDDSGDILPTGWNKVTLGSLMPGESARISYPVSVKPTASVALHTLSFNLTYTALDEPAAWTESFTLPVTQETRLEQGGLQMPGSVVQGDSATISLPLMNMGRGELRNVLATLSLPGIVERQSVLVGSIASGETKQAKLTVIPGKDALGQVSGVMEVTAEDEWGNGTGFSLPLSLTVEPAPEEKPMETTADLVKAMVPGYVWPLAGGCLALLLALIVQGVILRGRIHRLEEDKL